MKIGSGSIIVDPPWPYTDKITDPRVRGHSGEHYRAMSINQLADLRIGELGSYLFLWTTTAYTEDAFKLIRAWGFKPVTMMFWVKARRIIPLIGDKRHGFIPNYGTGHWFRGCVEPIIVAKKQNVKSIKTPYLGIISPNMQHSKKPKSLHQTIEKNYPTPHIELFARTERPNWVCMGDEISGRDIKKDIAQYLKLQHQK